MRVLIPRSRAGDPLVAALSHAGHRVLAADLITTAPAAAEILDGVLERLTGAEWLAITSATTVEVLAGRARAVGASLGELTRSVAVAAVGPATADALASAGVSVDLRPTGSSSAADLLAAWPEPTDRAGWVLWPRSARAAATLATGLAERGWQVEDVPVYDTVPAPRDPAVTSAFNGGRIDAVVLTSGSAAAALAQTYGPVPESVRIVTIGPVTAAAAERVGLPVHEVAAEQTPAGVVATLPRLGESSSVRRVVDPPPSPSRRVVTRVPTRQSCAGPSAPAPRPATTSPNGAAMSTGPAERPRRLRTTPAMRDLLAEHRTHPRDLILPMFVKERASEPVSLPSMPGVVQHTLDSLRRAATEAAEAGVGGLMLFGVPEVRDAVGSCATDPEGILNAGLRALVEEVGDDLVVMSDLCLDEFTDHGHCGVLDGAGRVDNDATLERYQDMALAQAETGAHMLGLSGMMDGQTLAVRQALDNAGHTDTSILAYSAKYASAFYGPFRDAVESQLQGDRRTYQMDPANRREGLREATLDLVEGADVVMVKPAMSYLDVLSDVAEASPVPVAAYQVSGEYAMIEAAAAQGWIERRRAVEESVLSIRRAGADVVLTYWATELAGWLR